MRTIDKIIDKVNCKFGAPMGRSNVEPKEFFIDKNENTLILLDGTDDGTPKTRKKVFDCYVPMSSCGAYDKGGAYWGIGKALRVSYTKDLTYIEFYRVN